jgi:hypothetical protein
LASEDLTDVGGLNIDAIVPSRTRYWDDPAR